MVSDTRVGLIREAIPATRAASWRLLRGTAFALALASSPTLTTATSAPQAYTLADRPVPQAAAQAAAQAGFVRQSEAALALDRLFMDDSRAEQALDPLGALEQGEQIPLDRFLLLFTPELVHRLRETNAATLTRLDGIARDQLDDAHRISYDVFRDAKLQERDALTPDLEVLTAVRPFNHFGGFHVEFPGLASSETPVPLETPADFEALLARDRALPQVFDHAIARFREGMADGVIESRLTVRNMIAQIDTILAQPVRQSPFYSPVTQYPAQYGTGGRRRIAAAFRQTIEQSVYPAYHKLRAFLADEYLPVAREDAGLWAMKGGDRLYRLLIRNHTTLPLDPDAVHDLGLGEVARIQHEMEGVKAELGYQGPLKAFFDELRVNPRYHPRTDTQLADGFRAVGRKVEAQAPRYFLHLPRTPLLIQPYPAYRARYEAGGSYSQGAPDGSRPGVFFYNTYDLKSRFLTGITTLYLHEGAPGHHFQISLAQENASLPDFQRFGGNTAYVEGWALYAETLGYEMGFYKDPMQHWGTLDDEMLRAMRLVVDTGIHAKRWTREQAIDYMLANSGMGRSDATAEVERYIANPGQALSYKIGALTIQRLRRKAEAELGPRFDIRAFHDQVLGSGALPMPVLEAKIDRWIARQKA